MSLALSSAWLAQDAPLLAPLAEVAERLGFHAVHAARPPRDAAAARAAFEQRGLAVAAVAADPVDDVGGIVPAVAVAARAASALRRPLVVLDLGRLPVPRAAGREAAVEALSRALHAALRSWPGLALGVRPSGEADRLLRFAEVEWLLDDLAAHPVGLWLDPVRALTLERGGAGPRVLDWADRFGRRTLGVALHGVGDGKGHARPEEDGVDWGTLREMVPARAVRVLDVGPAVPSSDVTDARRRLEEDLGW